MHDLIIQYVTNILYYSLSPRLPTGLALTLWRCSERSLLSQRPTMLHEVVALLCCPVFLCRYPSARLLVKVQIIQLQTTLGHVCIAVTNLCPATPEVRIFLPFDVIHSINRSRVTLHYELCLDFLKEQRIISYNINCTPER